jgi:hypothetical protein
VARKEMPVAPARCSRSPTISRCAGVEEEIKTRRLATFRFMGTNGSMVEEASRSARRRGPVRHGWNSGRGGANSRHEDWERPGSRSNLPRIRPLSTHPATACTHACTRPRMIGIHAPAPRPATFAHGRPGPALAPTTRLRQRRHVGPTWRDVGVHASTHTESAIMTPRAGIL